MAFGSSSAVFVRYVKDIMDRTSAMDLDGDAYKAALYNNTGTPDKTVSSANSAYNAGQWVTGNEVVDATNWVAGGRSLASVTWTVASNVVTFDANDTAGGGNVTLSNVFGCLVYDDTIATPVADQGVCFNSFGGSAQSVSAGTFTIVWHSSGIFAITV